MCTCRCTSYWYARTEYIRPPRMTRVDLGNDSRHEIPMNKHVCSARLPIIFHSTGTDPDSPCGYTRSCTTRQICGSTRYKHTHVVSLISSRLGLLSSRDTKKMKIKLPAAGKDDPLSGRGLSCTMGGISTTPSYQAHPRDVTPHACPFNTLLTYVYNDDRSIKQLLYAPIWMCGSCLKIRSNVHGGHTDR